jgi:hypothetical protein
MGDVMCMPSPLAVLHAYAAALRMTVYRCARDAALLRRFVEPQVEKVTEVFNHRKCVDGDYAMVNQAVRAQQMQMPTGVPAGGSWLQRLLCIVCTCLLHLYAGPDA